jgi:hypothetical protein
LLHIRDFEPIPGYTEQITDITGYSWVNLGRHVHVAQVGTSRWPSSVENPVSHDTIIPPYTGLYEMISIITKVVRSTGGLTKDFSWALGMSC